MKYEAAYYRAKETSDRDIKLLFQRLNFFLIATAFLLAAFATIVTVGGNSEVIKISYIIGVAGFIYSILIAIINHLNSTIIFKIGEYIETLEAKNFSEEVENALLPGHKISNIAKESINMQSGILLVLSMLRSFLNLVINLKEERNKSIASHTYFVPFIFSLVWLALLICLPIWS